MHFWKQNKQDRGCYVNGKVSKTSPGSNLKQSQEDDGERTVQADREVGGAWSLPGPGGRPGWLTPRSEDLKTLFFFFKPLK